MKLFIIAIALLFSTATLAQVQPENMLPEEFTTFIENEINRGLNSDIRVFKGYLNKTYEHGTSIENVTIAMQFVYCSIMWRNVHAILTEESKLTHVMLESGIWRAIESAKVHIRVAGVDSSKVESVMVPTLLEVSKVSEPQAVEINEANIYTCTALDLATYMDMALQGVPVLPPPDWTLEPIPDFNEIEPESEIGQRLLKYDS